MRQLNIKLNDMAIGTIKLGFQGENEATQIVFDCTEVFKEYPDATPTLAVENPEGTKYPVTIEQDENNVLWTVSSSDTAYPGEGRMQLTFTEDTTVVKSYNPKTWIEPSTSADDDPPDPIESWIDEVEDLLDDAEDATTAANNAAELANTKAGLANDAATAANAAATKIDDMEVAATDLAAGSTPTATITEVSGHKKITFGLVKGPKGDAGNGDMLAPAFAAGTANAAGTYVTYDGGLYYLPSGHTADATWANTTKTLVTVGGQLTDVKSAIKHRGVDEYSLNNKAYAEYIRLTKLETNATNLNLYDYNSSISGAINSSGEIVANTSYTVCPFMRVYDFASLRLEYWNESQQTTGNNSNNYVAFYDENFNYIANSLKIGQNTVTIPNGAVYFRCSSVNSLAPTTMIFGVPSGSTAYWATRFIPFMDGADNGYKFIGDIETLKTNTANNTKSIDVIEEKTKRIITKRDNLFNLDALNVGKKINGTTGELENDSDYVSSDYLDCFGLPYLLLATRNGTNSNPNDITKSSPGGLYWYFYNIDKEFITGSRTTSNPATVPETAYFARVMFSSSDYNWYTNNYKLVGVFGTQNVENLNQWNFYSPTRNEFDDAVFAIDGSKKHPQNISCWGDSLTDGSGDTGNTYGYVGRLGILIGRNKVNTNNFGMGGQNSKGIARRIGGMPVFVKPFTIPADTSAVAVEVYDIEGYVSSLFTRGSGIASPTLHNAAINPCVINGIEGTLTQTDNNGNYTFARSSSGEAVSVTRPALLETWGYRNNLDDITIIWAGTNDASSWMTIDFTIKNINSMVNLLTHKKYIILGLISKYVHQNVTDRNISLFRAYGRHFLDVRSYLLNYGLSDNGITPTSQDEEDIANGEIPSSLRSDNIHLNGYGYQALANCVYKYGKELGYWD